MFERGNRVIVNGSYGGRKFNDHAGTVISDMNNVVTVVVEFDKHIMGHGACGGKQGHVWCVNTELVRPFEDTNKDKLKRGLLLEGL